MKKNIFRNNNSWNDIIIKSNKSKNKKLPKNYYSNYLNTTAKESKNIFLENLVFKPKENKYIKKKKSFKINSFFKDSKYYNKTVKSKFKRNLNFYNNNLKIKNNKINDFTEKCMPLNKFLTNIERDNELNNELNIENKINLNLQENKKFNKNIVFDNIYYEKNYYNFKKEDFKNSFFIIRYELNFGNLKPLLKIYELNRMFVYGNLQKKNLKDILEKVNLKKIYKFLFYLNGDIFKYTLNKNLQCLLISKKPILNFDPCKINDKNFILIYNLFKNQDNSNNFNNKKNNIKENILNILEEKPTFNSTKLIKFYENFNNENLNKKLKKLNFIQNVMDYKKEFIIERKKKYLNNQHNLFKNDNYIISKLCNRINKNLIEDELNFPNKKNFNFLQNSLGLKNNYDYNNININNLINIISVYFRKIICKYVKTSYKKSNSLNLKSVNENMKLLNLNVNEIKLGTNFDRRKINNLFILFKGLCNITIKNHLNKDKILKESGIDFETFKNGIIELYFLEDSLKKKIFDNFKNNNDLIIWENFLNLVKKINTKSKKEKIEFYIKMYDKKGTGKLNYDDIFKICKKYLNKIINNDFQEFEDLCKYYTEIFFKECECNIDNEIDLNMIFKAINKNNDNTDFILMIFFI